MSEFNPEAGMEDRTQRDIEQDRAREQLGIAEILRQRDYRSDITVIGSDLIKEIQEAAEKGDYDRLREAIYEALPLTEGLEFGIFAESYGLPEEAPDLSRLSPEERVEAQIKENNVYAKMRNLFLTTEDSVDRGNTGYLRDAMLDTLSRPLRELEQWEVDDGVSWERRQRQVITDAIDRENFSRLLGGEEPHGPEEIERRVEQSIKLLREKQKEKMDGIREHREDLLILDHHVKARFVFDDSFRQRQYVAWNRDLQANMKESVGLGAAEPDGTHWQGFYQTDREWGEAVDKVERELVKMGMEGVTVTSTDGTAKQTKGIFTGNPDSKQFKAIVNRMLEVSRIEGKRRMDVVWAAWRQFTFKELAGKLDMDRNPIKGEPENGHTMSFNANPPYVGDLATWLNHPEEHRAAEFGWNEETLNANRTGDWNGRLVGQRAKAYKSVSHSGHPMSIGHLTEMDEQTDDDGFPVARFGRWKVGNFMEFATMRDEPEIDERFRGKNLWQIWWNGNLSQAHPDFPWVDTDFAAVKPTADEAPSGLVGYWFLQRGRAYTILKDNLGVPDMRGVSSIANVSGWRNWDKLKMVKPGKRMGNPAYVKILADIMFFKGHSGDSLKRMEKGESVSELELSGATYQEHLTSAAVGTNYPGINLKDYVTNAYNVGLIDHEEYALLSKISPRSSIKQINTEVAFIPSSRHPDD